MLKFEQGKSYLWLFPCYVFVFAMGFAFAALLGNVSWGILTMPAFIAFMMACEVRSAIALDSWWNAKYPRGCWQYRAILAWQTFGIIWMLGLSYFFIH